jgi:hypothetical protein
MTCKIEHMSLSRKRKLLYYDLPLLLQKRMRLSVKIKRNADEILLSIVNKKQKVCDSMYCLVHDYAYICEIYECSGVKVYNKSSFMSYIN